MSGRLVGEVAEWLRSPAAEGMTLAERTVLLIVAERSNEKTREMWRYKTDEATSFEYICQVAGIDRSGLTKALRKLAVRGFEVRVPLDFDRNGRPIFAFKGAAMKFALPPLPPSVELPERVDEDPPSPPVDNSPGEPSETPTEATEGWMRGHPNDSKGAPEGTLKGSKGGREGTPNPYKEDPYKDHPYTRGSSSDAAELEDSPSPAATPPAKTSHHMGWNPDYISARDYLQTLADLGDEFMNKAREDLGPDAPVADRVIYAAQIAHEGIPA